VHAYATWRVLRRLRRSAERADRPRTYTRNARVTISAAAALLNWLADHGIPLAEADQTDVETWLTGGPARYQARDFLRWAAGTGHARTLQVPTLGRTPGRAIGDDERLKLVARLLHDDDLELTDRVAGALLLLYGQPLSRITAMTTDQVSTRGGQTFLRLGREDINIPEPLDGLLLALTRQPHRYLGVGTPNPSKWLFPGMQPGRPLTAARLGERLRALGIRAQPGRRSAMTHLAAQLPPPCSPTCSTSPPPQPSAGSATPAATGPATPPNWPGQAITNHDEYSPPHAVQHGHSPDPKIAGYQFGRRGTCAMCTSPPDTPTRAPPCATTGRARTSTDTPTTSWPRSRHPAPDHSPADTRGCR
jgi:hypothetical protein